MKVLLSAQSSLGVLARRRLPVGVEPEVMIKVKGGISRHQVGVGLAI